MSLRDPNPSNRKAPKRVAIVIANPATSTTTGWPVGFWWSELTHPYYAFHEAGYEVEVFSPAGGKCEADGLSDPRDASGYSASDLISMGFLNTPSLVALLEATRPVSEIDPARFDAIVVAGGQAPMFSFEKAIDLHKKFAEFYEAGKIACALCHGVALLRYAKLSNGDLLAKGKTVTGFANVEEDFADEAVWSMGALTRERHLMPWRIEDELKKARRELRARRDVAGLCCAGWQPHYRPTEFLRRGDREPRHREPRALTAPEPTPPWPWK